MEENVKRQQTEDWIDHIINKTFENYNGRKIVIWGSYGISKSISGGLKEKYGIDTAFYVDNDTAKIDEKYVFSPENLSGKSDKYYVIIPIAFYQSIREKLVEGGYSPDVDYYYFSDCVLQQTPEYYEDAHGNKIIGKCKGLKFCFSGFNSVIEIGDNVQFRNASFYIHSDSKIVIGNNVQIVESELYIYNARLEMKCGCDIVRLYMKIKQQAEVILNEKVMVCGQKTIWEIDRDAKLQIGNKSFLGGGICGLGEKAVFNVGKEFSINEKYRIVICGNTSIFIGDDCMFSYDIGLRSNDGHSIFDVATRENINCSYNISRNRKIVIGNHVWVGERAEILYNTQIGDGSIIGAMSLVKSEIPNNCIAAGIPARIIRKNISWSRQYGAEDILECRKEYIHYTEEL